MEYLGYLLVAVVVCGVFGGVIYVLSRKAQKDLEEKLEHVTKEQKEQLINTPYREAPGCPNGAIVRGLIYEMKQKSTGGCSLYVLYYNTYFPNFQDQITHMDVSVDAKTAKEHPLKEGDFIDVLLNEDKNPKIVF